MALLSPSPTLVTNWKEEKVKAIAVGMTCIPTLREEVVRLRQVDLLDQAEARQLELLAREIDEREPRAPVARQGPKGALRRSHHRWPARLAHTH